MLFYTREWALSLTPESKLDGQRRRMEHRYTLGGKRLQTLRKQAGKTQLVVEADAGLGSGYIQRIESGKVRQPERTTLERILTALDARYSECHDVLALFGYRVATPLPSTADITWAREVAAEELAAVPFPAYLLDCGVRLLAWNRFVPHIFPVVGQNQQQIMSEYWSMFSFWFDPRYGITERVCNPETLFAHIVRAFRHELYLMGEEPWCEAMIASLMRDVPLFRGYWEQADVPPTASAARALVPLQILLPGSGMLQFRISAESFTRDARFRIVYLLPADPRTMQQCVNWAASPS